MKKSYVTLRDRPKLWKFFYGETSWKKLTGAIHLKPSLEAEADSTGLGTGLFFMPVYWLSISGQFTGQFRGRFIRGQFRSKFTRGQPGVNIIPRNHKCFPYKPFWNLVILSRVLESYLLFSLGPSSIHPWGMRVIWLWGRMIVDWIFIMKNIMIPCFPGKITSNVMEELWWVNLPLAGILERNHPPPTCKFATILPWLQIFSNFSPQKQGECKFIYPCQFRGRFMHISRSIEGPVKAQLHSVISNTKSRILTLVLSLVMFRF